MTTELMICNQSVNATDWMCEFNNCFKRKFPTDKLMNCAKTIFEKYQEYEKLNKIKYREKLKDMSNTIKIYSDRFDKISNVLTVISVGAIITTIMGSIAARMALEEYINPY